MVSPKLHIVDRRTDDFAIRPPEIWPFNTSLSEIYNVMLRAILFPGSQPQIYYWVPGNLKHTKYFVCCNYTDPDQLLDQTVLWDKCISRIQVHRYIRS